MNVGVANSLDNPTHSYLNSKGIWVTYLLIVYMCHLLLLSVPFFSVAIAWTLTNAIHSVMMFVLLHLFKGTPWESSDQGSDRFKTQWEQIDHGMQWTATRKFFIFIPIVIFFIASFYTKYDTTHFIINAVFMLLSVVPKFPVFDGVRIFGINKY